ncbi:fumarate hydratase C-terminal domain-containing protein [Clostridium sp. AM58-1XD]|uniref:fumarate hydratase C-terminal domain-containing protein n=1 Tax=Clostridium sp. AM58-1XD TaxID=2292307 RepID=UPI000E4BE2F9|nr:fumarate hydratase C-terminal domain-containing protein [Clostridium sp. AM58-1XD]RGY96748.1 fumarate hydratase [Clostridium sp. AM58-1XD]
MKRITTPISEETARELQVGDQILISGYIYCGRDAVLPRVCAFIESGEIENIGICLQGGVIFHTAVSPAGVGPTSSNKPEIEGSFEGLSKAGVKIHLGKGEISRDTIRMLEAENAVYAVIPPVTALLGNNTLEQRLAAFPELGMEALYELKVVDYPAIIAAAHNRSIY